MNSDENLNWMKVTLVLVGLDEKEEGELQEKLLYLDFSREMEESL